MKRIGRNFLVVLVSVLALSAFTFAQDATYHLNVNVPFAFYAAEQQLPAGTYLFSVNYGNHAVTLRNQQTGRSYALLGVPGDGENSGQAVVEFDVVGENHLLTDLKTSNTGVGFSSHAPAVTSAQRRGSVAILATLR